jgi:hypothetical protein
MVMTTLQTMYRELTPHKIMPMPAKHKKIISPVKKHRFGLAYRHATHTTYLGLVGEENKYEARTL